MDIPAHILSKLNADDRAELLRLMDQAKQDEIKAMSPLKRVSRVEALVKAHLSELPTDHEGLAQVPDPCTISVMLACCQRLLGLEIDEVISVQENTDYLEALDLIDTLESAYLLKIISRLAVTKQFKGGRKKMSKKESVNLLESTDNGVFEEPDLPPADLLNSTKSSQKKNPKSKNMV